MGIFIELVHFIVKRKLFVLGPIIFISLSLGGLLVLGGNATFAPFIYAIF